MAASCQRSGNLCLLTGVPDTVISTLKAYMEYDHHYLEPVMGRMMARSERRRLWVDHAGGLVFPAGFFLRVTKVCADAGIPDVAYTRLDARRELVWSFDDVNVLTLRPEQEQMLASMVANDGGLVVSPTGSGKSYLLRELCALYPDATIVICAPTIDAVATLKIYLEDRFPGKVGQYGGGRKFVKRITVSTYDSVLAIPSIGDTDILIVDEVHKAPAGKYAKVLSAISSPVKRFGFTATPEGRSDGAELVNEGLFGPVIVRFHYQEAVATGSVAPLHIIVRPCRKGPTPDDIKRIRNTASKDRMAIWRNADRNQVIADDIRSIMTSRPNPQVLIIVDRSEHAFVLKTYLPDFDVVVGSVSEKTGKRLEKIGITDAKALTAKGREDAVRAFSAGEMRKVIATAVWAAAVSSNECDVVGYAGGQGAVINFLQVMGRAGRVCEGKDAGTVYLVKDTFHRGYANRANKLIRAAKEAGHAITVLEELR